MIVTQGYGYSAPLIISQGYVSAAPPIVGEFPGGVWTEEFRGLVFLEDARGLIWEAGDMNTLVKRPGERRTYIFRFSKLPEIAVSKDTLASIVSITAALATQPPVGAGTPPGISNQAIASASDITAFITNGDGGNSWLFICLADTAGGSRLACEGTLLINDG